ncbi:MAG: DUF4167 domain-containing protein [Rhizobiaceae bacterium]|nr:DUF4167 domain-containing protein [Rhizobiaceae bacterium]
MRPQQQNRRMRGRGNNNNNNNNNNNHNQNRRGPNPLTRSYESNGPDVKIRGTAQQVAEKYTTLARDAQSSGDRVMAENYLQHAEHYNRIIAAALAQQALQQQQQPRDANDDFDGEGEGDDGIEMPRGFETPQVQQPQQSHANQQQPHQAFQQQPPQFLQPQGYGPQPVIEGIPAEVAHAEGGMNGDANGGREHFGENGGANGQANDGAPRRGRRRRPMRSRSGEGGVEQNGGSEDGGDAGEAAPQTEGEPV